MLEVVAQIVVEMVAIALLYVLIRFTRSKWAGRRQEAVEDRIATDVPIRLRGVTRMYPGVFRLGRLELATARWRPGFRWGIPVSLAGAQVGSPRPAAEDDAGLPAIVNVDDVVLVGQDRHGSAIELAVYADEVPLVRQCLAAAQPADPAEADVHSRWQWLQNLIPPSTVACLLVGIAWLGGMISIASETGDARDPVALTLIFGGAALWWALAGAFAGRQAWHRRRLARTHATPVHLYNDVGQQPMVIS